MATRDTDVVEVGTSLKGTSIVLGISGGIAAVESVKLARELRRHGATLTVIMTPSAQRIITPLAVRWASQCEVVTDWDGDLTALSEADAVLIAPATRDIMASHLHGLQHGPLMMALSVARSRNTPIMMVPSMHEDLANDPMTENIGHELTLQDVNLLWGPQEEGKRKTPDSKTIVASLCHQVNRRKTKRKSIVITLGATRSAVDDIRHLQNTSSGKTGWDIADHLYRHGHDVTCVAGVTSAAPPPWLTLVIYAPTPEEMLEECFALANDSIHAWVHAAAVLDYVVGDPAEGKIASQQGALKLELIESTKHIKALQPTVEGCVRIGFKLESGIKQKDLIYRAVAQIESSGMTAVVANRLEDRNDPNKPRGYLVDQLGAHFVLQDQRAMCEAIQTLIERGVEE